MESILHRRGDGPYNNRCRMKDFLRVRSPVPVASQGVPEESMSGQGSMLEILEQHGIFKKVDTFDPVPRPEVANIEDFSMICRNSRSRGGSLSM